MDILCLNGSQTPGWQEYSLDLIGEVWACSKESSYSHLKKGEILGLMWKLISLVMDMMNIECPISC